MHERQAGSGHPIDVMSRNNAVRLIRSLGLPAEPVVIDIGCSSGYLVEELKCFMPRARVICSDYLAEALERLQRDHPEIPLLQFDACHCPLPDECVDVVTMLNVLEHIQDDRRAISEVFRILKPGGCAYIEVPVHPMLYGLYDRYLLHHRRYRFREIRKMLMDAGFEVRATGYLGFSIFLPFCVVKLLDRARDHLSEDASREKVKTQIKATRNNVAVRVLLNTEFRIGHYLRFPTGIRCWLALRKPAVTRMWKET